MHAFQYYVPTEIVFGAGSVSKLPELLAAFPNKYQIKRYEGKGGATIIAYKSL